MELKKNSCLLTLWTLGLLSCSLFSFSQNDTTIKVIPKTHNMLVLPLVSRSIETNWAFGVAGSATFHIKSGGENTRTSNLQALTLYTLRHQFIAAINGSIYFPGEQFILNQQISYSFFPDEFWGLGKNTPDSNKEHYSYKQFYVYLHPQYRVGKNMFVGLLYEYQRVMDVQYTAGGLFDKENIAGREGYHISGLGSSFTYDTRNNAFAPDKGMLMQFSFNHFDHIFASGYEYTNFVLDFRKFMRLYKNQVLALQANAFFNIGTVPIRSLASLGGANSMRGYYDGRFRDKNKAVIQAEYRVPLFWRIGVVAFGDIGNVSDHVGGLDLSDLKYTYGAGLRFALDKVERLNLRFDYGATTHFGHGFYLQLGEAF